MTRLPNRGLYAITPNGISSSESGLQRVRHVLQGGAALLQYRDELANHKTRRDFGASLAQLCRDHGVPLIINDDPVLALELDAAGVHLGEHDTDPAQAAKLLGQNAIIGVSCYNDLQRALRAQRLGATYLAFGSLFASSTKPGARHCPADKLAAFRPACTVPVVAIGGITHQNGASVIAAGADFLAVISHLFVSGQEFDRARQLAALFNQQDLNSDE